MIKTAKKIGILLTGKAGAGKDQVADTILKGTYPNLYKYAIADYLKSDACETYKIPREIFYGRHFKDTKMFCDKSKSPRDVLIELAFKRRKYDKYYYIRKTYGAILFDERDDKYNGFIISDCRDLNEIEYIEDKFKDYKLVKIWIERFKNKLNVIDNLHLRDTDCDFILYNELDKNDPEYEKYIFSQIKMNSGLDLIENKND